MAQEGIPTFKWWIPEQGIIRSVIDTDISLYLGRNARIKPGYGRDENDGRFGYWIAADRPLTPEMIVELKDDSTSFKRSGSKVPYNRSTVHKQRKESRSAKPSVAESMTITQPVSRRSYFDASSGRSHSHPLPLETKQNSLTTPQQYMPSVYSPQDTSSYDAELSLKHQLDSFQASSERVVDDTEENLTRRIASSRANHRDFRRQSDHRRFFVFGRVFQCLWNEEFPGTKNNGESPHVTENAYGQHVYSKYRTFVVIENNQNHSSQCVSISTHGGRGVPRQMVKAHYSIIYAGHDAPQPLEDELPGPGERGMRRSIRVKLRSKIDRLHERSRINYKMSFPIQHNYKVYDMGMVREEYQNILWEEYCAVNGRMAPSNLGDSQSILPSQAQHLSRTYSGHDQESPYESTKYLTTYLTEHSAMQDSSSGSGSYYAQPLYPTVAPVQPATFFPSYDGSSLSVPTDANSELSSTTEYERTLSTELKKSLTDALSDEIKSGEVGLGISKWLEKVVIGDVVQRAMDVARHVVNTTRITSFDAKAMVYGQFIRTNAYSSQQTPWDSSSTLVLRAKRGSLPDTDRDEKDIDKQEARSDDSSSLTSAMIADSSDVASEDNVDMLDEIDTTTFTASLIGGLKHDLLSLTIKKAKSRIKELAQGVANSTDASNSSQQHNDSSSIVQGSEQNVSRTSQGKRKQFSHNDDSGESRDDEDDENGPPPKPKKAKNIDESFLDPNYACHFFKHDHERYPLPRFRACNGPGFPTIHRVKEHLIRRHKLPVHCPRCYKEFKAEKELASHLRTDCVINPGTNPFEGVNGDQIKALKSRKTMPGQTEEERWKDIYRSLFPDELVPSPYYGPMDKFSRGALDAFTTFLEARLPTSIENAVINELASAAQETGGGIVSQIQDIVRRCLREASDELLVGQGPSSRNRPPSPDSLVDGIEGEQGATDIMDTGWPSLDNCYSDVNMYADLGIGIGNIPDIYGPFWNQ